MSGSAYRVSYSYECSRTYLREFDLVYDYDVRGEMYSSFKKFFLPILIHTIPPLIKWNTGAVHLNAVKSVLLCF